MVPLTRFPLTNEPIAMTSASTRCPSIHTRGVTGLTAALGVTGPGEGPGDEPAGSAAATLAVEELIGASAEARVVTTMPVFAIFATLASAWGGPSGDRLSGSGEPSGGLPVPWPDGVVYISVP